MIIFIVFSTCVSTQKNINIDKSEPYLYFKKNISPILQTTCSAKDEKGNYVCHGKTYLNVEDHNAKMPEFNNFNQKDFTASCATSCHKMSDKIRFSYSLNSTGNISTEKQIMLMYLKAKKRTNYTGNIKFSKILRMPLAAQSGGFGLYHGGGEIYESTADPDYRKLAEWVKLETQNLSNKVLYSSKTEQYFGENALPVFARNNCLSPSCHIFNHSSFVPDLGMPTDDLNKPLNERFSLEQISFNRMTAKGLIQSIVYLTGDIEQSRILKKNIPIEQGGVLHRGGNNQFFTGPDDPDYQIIRKWLELEREEVLSRLKINNRPVNPKEVGKIKGLVFIRTKTNNHRHYFDIGKYLPGGDLYLLKLKEGETLETTASKPINLTTRFHPNSEADIREPDVRYDGRTVVFSMRIGKQDNLNLYEIELNENLDYVEGSFRRLTYGPKEVNGIKVHYTDPTYVPDPLDENAASGGYNLDKVDLVFVSNLSGNVIQSVERGTVGEADGGDHNVIIDFDRPEVNGSFVGHRIFIVDGSNKGEWRKIIDFKNKLFTKEMKSYITVEKSFSKPIDNSSIYVIERDPNQQPGVLPSYSMYGIKYSLKGKEKWMYNETISRITYGVVQELDLSVRTTGEVFYSSLRSGLNKYDRPIFNVASCRRHLDTRFSFPTHHGNRSQVLIYADNHELPFGNDIHCGMDPDNVWEGGNLNTSDHQMGPGLEARNPNDYATGYFDENGIPVIESTKISNVRFNYKQGKQASHTRTVFKKNPLFPLRGPKAVSRTGFSPGGIFKDPIPLPNGDILTSHSSKPINHLDINANPDFDLYVLKPVKSYNAPNGKGVPKIEKILLKSISKKGLSDIQPYPIFIRIKPKINAGKRPKKEHLIRFPGTPEDTRPTKYLERNFLLIDAIMNDPAPVGKSVAYKTNPVSGQPTLPIDIIKYVRMVEVLPLKPEDAIILDRSQIKNNDPESTLISNGIHLKKRIVGEAPLEDDGSIFIKIPGQPESVWRIFYSN